MKKIIACVLCFVMVLSCVAFASCASVKKDLGVVTDSVYGKTPDEAYREGISVFEGKQYSASVDMELSFKVAVINLDLLDCEDVYFYTYDHENQHYGVSIDLQKELSNPIAGTIIKSITGEDVTSLLKEDLPATEYRVWHYNGIYYTKAGNEKRQHADESTVETIGNPFEKAVETLMAEGDGELTCYIGEEASFQIVVDNPRDFQINTEGLHNQEVYTVFFDRLGRITEIDVYLDAPMLGLSFEIDYDYDNIRVTPPADLENYIAE